MLPPDHPQGAGGTGPPSAPSGVSAQEEGAQEEGVQPAGGAGEGTGLVQDGNGAAGEPSTITLPAPAAGEAGQRLGGQRSLRSILGQLGHDFRRLNRAVAGAAAAAGRTARRSRSAPGPADQAVKVRSADIAGTVLARLTVLPAVLILAWLIPGVLLLLAGQFLPVPMILISVSLAAAITVNGLRVVPASSPRLLSAAHEGEPGWTTWFGLLATVVVVAGLTGWQLTESSQALIVVRDQGTYLQAGYWLAQHGSLPIPQLLSGFGAAHGGLNFASTGFLVRGTGLYPAVMPGLPLLLAGGFWVHGFSGALAIGPVLGGLATLTFAGLVARLIGPQWAPAGALILGLSLPQQYIGRTSLSETALQIMLFGGLCLVADSVALRGTSAVLAVRAADGPEARSARNRLAVAWQLAVPSRWAAQLTPQRVLAALGGLVLSFGLLISLDALACLLAVIPFAAALVIGRRPQAAPFLSGLVVGLCYGVLSLYLLDRPFLDSVGQTVALAGVVAVWLVTMSVLALQFARIDRVRKAVPRALARRPLRWLPEAGALLAVAAVIAFAVRPYVQQVRGHPVPGVYDAIRALQRLQGLPVDPTRTYAEQTLYWVIWYIGLPTVLLGTFGLALVVRRCLRALLTWQDPTGVWRIWGLPLAMICAGSVVMLWAPDIVPDQPWASRRLIVVAIPGLILFAFAAAAWLARRARDTGARPVTAAVAGIFCAAAMLVPTVSTTFGLGFSHAGKAGGLKPVAQGLALTRTGAGQIGALRELCASIPRNATVIIVAASTGAEFSQVIRGMCEVPVARMDGQPMTAILDEIGSISAAGRRPLLVAASRAQLAGYGGTPVHVLDLGTTTDPRDLTRLPTSLQPVRYQVWLTQPASAGSGT